MLGPTFEKQLNILDYGLAGLWRRKAKNLSLLAVFTAVIFLLASFQMVVGALTRAADTTLSHAPEIIVQKMVAGRQESIPLAYGERFSAAIFGIRRIVPRIWGYQFDEVNGANYTIMGLEPWLLDRGGDLGRTLAEGRIFGPGEEGVTVVGQAIPAAMELGERRTISFFRPDLELKPLKIIGVFKEETDLLTNDLVVMPLTDARDLFGLKAGLVTDLCVYVANPAEIETIGRKIAALLPDTRVITKPQIRKTYQVVFGWRSGFGSICLLTALAAFGILAWDKAAGLSPEERREIAILKFLGWETSDVLALRFWESFLISSLALVLGCTLGYCHVAFLDAALFRPIMVGWSVIFPPFRLVPEVALSDLLLIFSFSVLPYLAATIIPAWRAAIVPPDAAMR